MNDIIITSLFILAFLAILFVAFRHIMHGRMPSARGKVDANTNRVRTVRHPSSNVVHDDELHLMNLILGWDYTSFIPMLTFRWVANGKSYNVRIPFLGNTGRGRAWLQLMVTRTNCRLVKIECFDSGDASQFQEFSDYIALIRTMPESKWVHYDASAVLYEMALSEAFGAAMPSDAQMAELPKDTVFDTGVQREGRQTILVHPISGDTFKGSTRHFEALPISQEDRPVVVTAPQTTIERDRG